MYIYQWIVSIYNFSLPKTKIKFRKLKYLSMIENLIYFYAQTIKNTYYNKFEIEELVVVGFCYFII